MIYKKIIKSKLKKIQKKQKKIQKHFSYKLKN